MRRTTKDGLAKGWSASLDNKPLLHCLMADDVEGIALIKATDWRAHSQGRTEFISSDNEWGCEVVEVRGDIKITEFDNDIYYAPWEQCGGSQLC